jgi:hypothetical protein
MMAALRVNKNSAPDAAFGEMGDVIETHEHQGDFKEW